MKHPWRIRFCLIFVLSFSHSAVFSKDDPPFNSRTTLLSTLPPDAQIDQLTFSRDGQNVAYKVKQGDQWAVIQNGKKHKSYEKIGLVFDYSVDGKSLAYTAKIKNQWTVVVNGKEGPKYDGIDNLILWCDNGSLSYLAKRGESKILVVDQKEVKTFPLETGGPTCSADIDKVQHIKEKDGQYYIFEGKPGKKYDRVGNFHYSAAAKHYAYEAWRGKKMLMVMNEVEGKEYDQVGLWDITASQ